MISPELEIIEKQNQSKDPTRNFKFLMEDLENCVATWHTHPSGSANLSIDDYWFFQSWTTIGHFIIFKSEVRFYQPFEGQLYLVDEERDHPSWLSEGLVRQADHG